MLHKEIFCNNNQTHQKTSTINKCYHLMDENGTHHQFPFPVKRYSSKNKFIEMAYAMVFILIMPPNKTGLSKS